MRMQLQDVIGSGVDLLDSGITDLEVAVIDGIVHLYSSTGRYGGVVQYALGADGEARVTTSVIFPESITATVGDRIVLSEMGGGLTLLIGSQSGGLTGYALGADGGFGSRVSVSWTVLQAAVADGQISAAEAMILLGDTAPASFPTDFDCGAITGIADVTIGSVTLVIAACDARDGVTAFIVDPRTGALTEVDTMGAAEGIGISAPTALEVVQIAGETYVIVAAAGTNSLSVMRLNADGSLELTEHRLDNGSTRFEGVQSLAVAVSGDHAFVIAGGADNGLSLFLMLPDGTLVHLQTLGDTSATTMNKVTSISAVVDGDTLYVFVGSQNDSGITQLEIDLSNLGRIIEGGAAANRLNGTGADDILMAVGSGDTLNGGGGDDVLVAGEGQTHLRGGSGSDIFVIRDGSTTTHVLDFERGVDALDLSDMPMLRDLTQLTITVTAGGARIEYRGHVIHITASDGRSLTLDDLFPDGLIGGDRIPAPTPEEFIGIRIDGDDGAERLEGTGFNDTINGGGGNDTLIGDDGNDVIDGGALNDLIEAGLGDDSVLGGDGDDSVLGGEGRDTIHGGQGTDTLHGGMGDDAIEGGIGDDRLYGELGNDLLRGGDGADTLFGGAEHDTLSGGAGSDLLDGEAGNDRVFGNAGEDTILGGAGDDRLFGGTDDDLLRGGAGDDRMGGGAGNDRLFGNAGNDRLFGGGGNDRLVGGGGDDRLGGSGGNDRLVGGGGNDIMRGAQGSDRLWGGMGDDRLYGGTQRDLLFGGGGNDSLYGGHGGDTLEGDNGDDLLDGGGGQDRIFGGRGHDLLLGENGRDRLVGNQGNDGLFGGRGMDTLLGGVGDDVLDGEGGDDLLKGGVGQDVLRGGRGNDVLIGGGGADIFEFHRNDDTGRILDFDPREGDLLRLDDAIWSTLGTLTAEEVVAQFASLDGDGNIVLDFSDIGGCVIILDDFDNLNSLADAIVLM